MQNPRPKCQMSRRSRQAGKQTNDDALDQSDHLAPDIPAKALPFNAQLSSSLKGYLNGHRTVARAQRPRPFLVHLHQLYTAYNLLSLRQCGLHLSYYPSAC